ncbi:MAG: hypothetical protein WCR30_04610 [Clostridia bacterium]
MNMYIFRNFTTAGAYMFMLKIYVEDTKSVTTYKTASEAGHFIHLGYI